MISVLYSSHLFLSADCRYGKSSYFVPNLAPLMPQISFILKLEKSLGGLIYMKKVIIIAMTALVMAVTASVFAAPAQNAPPGSGCGCCGGGYYGQK